LSISRSLTAAARQPAVGGDLLENGYGDAPEIVAETVRLAVAAGLAGGSIEDATTRRDDPIYELARRSSESAQPQKGCAPFPLPSL
jgi:2-methylisocitrate lyase-like PEP mutase family enzyme